MEKNHLCVDDFNSLVLQTEEWGGGQHDARWVGVANHNLNTAAITEITVSDR